MHLTRQLKIKKTNNLDNLAHESGIVYSKALVLFKRILRKKNIWLSKYSMQKLVKNNNLHSQTVQGIIDKLYDNISSWRKLRKINPKARLPKKRKWYFVLPFKSTAIKVKKNELRLSNGKNNTQISLDWKYDTPKFITISFDGQKYVVNATYQINDVTQRETGETAGIDLGEIHLGVANVDNKTFILNGRVLRSKRRYQNKIKGSFAKRISKCKNKSRKNKKLRLKKRQILRKLDNQIKDILHKQTTKLVYALDKLGVNTVAIGDVRNLRQNVDYGRHANQRIHQMVSGKVRSMLEYKFNKLGIAVDVINEAYSSQTCPKCLNRHKPSNRNYICKVCGFDYHRDGVGAINIRQKKMYLEYAPVVGDMTPPVGFRYIA